MTLSLALRISAAYIGVWILLLVITPAMVASDLFNVELNASLQAQMQITALAAFGVASLHWMIPSWAPDNMAKFGRLAAAVWAAFALLNAYFILAGILVNSLQNISTPVIMAAIAILLFVKSKD
jgi:hypothetical protein